MTRRFLRVVFSAAAAICVAFGAPAEAARPKLVLAIVVDQFRYDYLLRFRSDYHSGLAKLLEKGAVMTDAYMIHATTVTAVGHSTFLSGAPPSVSGIINNEWFDREAGKTVTSVSDPMTKLVGGAPGLPGSSPRRLLVSTVGDEVKMHGIESHAIGVSIKDRSAILPVGHMADGAYWYDDASNNWVTSSYYRDTLPDWAQAVNAKHEAKQFSGKSWLPVDAKEGSAKPFCIMGGGAGVRACGAIEATPWGNEMIEEFAERALDGENLGRHSGVDLLTVSFSSNDYVGHALGPDAPEVRDISIRTDRLLGKLLEHVDARVGAGNTLVVLTADHGVGPSPEINQARHMPGGRIQEATLTKAINDALAQRFGPGNWIVSTSSNMPYLNLELVGAGKLNAAEVEEVAARAVRSQPHIARVYTREELMTGAVQRDAVGNAVSLGFYAPRFGDLYILPEPYYIIGGATATHGTPYDYDAHVPLIFYGPGIKPGTYTTRVAVNDVAPTLSQILNIERPSGSIGQVLNQILQ